MSSARPSGSKYKRKTPASPSSSSASSTAPAPSSSSAGAGSSGASGGGGGGKKHKKATAVSHGLPRAVNVMHFATARAAEITQLSRQLQNASQGNRRVFQTLPRHLRRRAMSHNLHRLPARLRKKASKEVEKMGGGGGGETGSAGPASGNRRRRRRRQNAMAEYARRQRRHVWLETHLWMAKRMHMQNMWGYRLPMSSTQKGARPTYRAAAHQCVAHDLSYVGAVQLQGSRDAILELLAPFLPTTGAGVAGAEFADGGRQGTCMLHERGAFPLGAVCPIDFLWSPAGGGGGDAGADAHARQLWVWVHPSVFDDVWRMLAAVDMHEVQVRDLRTELLRFELMGDRSHAVLEAVFKPLESLTAHNTGVDLVEEGGAGDEDVNGDDDGDSDDPVTRAASAGGQVAHVIWASLHGLLSTSCLPQRAVLGLEVEDFRLFSPKQPFVVAPDSKKTHSIPSRLPRPSAQSASGTAASVVAEWPQDTAVSRLWDPVRRQEQKQRAGEKPVPQSHESVSVMLVQRPGGLSGGFGSGWDVIISAGWGMALWNALTYGGARPLGVEDRKYLLLEQGLPCFPFEHPDTVAGQMFDEFVANEQRIYHDKRSAANRVNYTLLGITSPFRPDWPSKLLPSRAQDDAAAAASGAREAGQEDGNEAGARAAPTVRRVAVARSRQRVASLFALSEADCLVSVKLEFPKGKPNRNAIISMLEDDELAAVSGLGVRGAKDDWAPPTEPAAKPSTMHLVNRRPIVGHVTSGVFSYVRGCGFGIGLVSIEAFRAIVHGLSALEAADAGNSGWTRAVPVLVRNTTCNKHMLAYASIIVDAFT